MLGCVFVVVVVVVVVVIYSYVLFWHFFLEKRKMILGVCLKEQNKGKKNTLHIEQIIDDSPPPARGPSNVCLVCENPTYFVRAL